MTLYIPGTYVLAMFYTGLVLYVPTCNDFLFRALLLSVHKLPEKRKVELEEVVHGYFGVTDITTEMLEEAKYMDVKLVLLHYQRISQLNTCR